MEPLGDHDQKRVGPYRLLGRLGAGGMGQVYLGRDRRGQLVAVKVVHPGFAHDEQFRVRFRREVAISRAVTGPWVAAVVDADPDARTPWLATEYVRGPSLSAAIEAHGPLPVGTVHALAHGLAFALSVVHDAGLVHRDLKPSNVLLGSDHPRLIDFGISRAIDGTRVTSTGVVVGTPAFMSPEQIAGEDVGPPSDVFSLGSVLAYAATGHSPFGDHTPLVLMMRISGHEPDLDGLPVVLREHLAACLAKRPEDRPTAAELGGMFGTVEIRAAGEPGWLPAQVSALGSDLDGPTVPHARTRRMTEVDVPAGAPRLNRRALLATLGTIGILSAGGIGAVAALSPPRPPLPRWTATVPWPGTVVAAAVDDRTLYLCSQAGGGAMLALDTTTGAQRWSAPGRSQPEILGDDAAAVVRVGEALIVGTRGLVAAFDTATGRRRWEAPRGFRVAWGSVGIAVAEGTVAATTRDGFVALDAETGDRIWGTSEELVDVAAHNGMCFSGHDDVIDARGLRTGRQMWSYRSTGHPVRRLVAAGDFVVVEGDDLVVGLDAATGQQRWSLPRSVTASDGPHVVIVGDVLVAFDEDVAGRGVVGAFELSSGAQRWSQSEPEWFRQTRLVGADGIVYVLPSGGSQRAYDAATGDKRWDRGQGDSAHPYSLIAAREREAYLQGGSPGEVQAFTIP